MTLLDPRKLLDTLCAEPRETEWLEFKVSQFDPDDCGEYVSGLANSAILAGEQHGYLVWGVEDLTHSKVGTENRLKTRKVGGEPFENWLARSLDPKLNLQFVCFDDDGKHFEIIVIDPAYQRPVRFKGEEFIRIDTALKKLREYPERARTLWELTSRFAFEQGVAKSHVAVERLLEEFDLRGLMNSLGKKGLSDDAVIEHGVLEGLISDDKYGGYDVSNLCAILCAEDLRKISHLTGKRERVIQYKGKNKLEAIDDATDRRGYALTFSGLLKYIMKRVPHTEEFQHGERVEVFSYPEIAVREFVANAIIHQDFTSRGDGPTIEIFSDRLQITNPGVPLIPTDRFIDHPPKSRNEKLSDIMRRLNLCERRGSGIDRALDAIEAQALPSPTFQVVEGSTVVTLFKERAFGDMSHPERVRACFQHAILKWVENDPMSNGSLRIRFGLNKNQYTQVSNVIRETIDAGFIKPLEEDQANRNARYVPKWA